MRYRLYLDEIGHANPSRGTALSDIYLSLSGVIVELGYSNRVLFPNIEKLKADFCPTHHADDPVIFHRTEMINKNFPFDHLRDPAIEVAFNERLLRFLVETPFKVITVVIDKPTLRTSYDWPFHPYHFCLELLLERYVFWLKANHSSGDILAESRSEREDRQLQEEFAQLFQAGNYFLKNYEIQKVITSKWIKFKTKKANVAGLQLTELIAHPSFRTVLAMAGKHETPNGMGQAISRILISSKYHRSRSGQIMGFGTKFFPQNVKAAPIGPPAST